MMTELTHFINYSKSIHINQKVTFHWEKKRVQAHWHYLHSENLHPNFSTVSPLFRAWVVKYGKTTSEIIRTAVVHNITQHPNWGM